MSNEETPATGSVTHLTADPNVIRFPMERLGIEEEVLFHCKACNHKITESMEKDEKDEKNKVLPLSLGPLVIYVCPNCYTLQLPEEVFKEILKKSTLNIIT